ncbi:phosphatidate cytidylyltransferase [Polymorphospora sp. NPDC050346]|uniref:phosphatidate cytidylyltransferase n=1 Tax=Polymorphospora sp. NPDC050346 TaxID=3155780 RepID=UPI0033E8B02C
MSYLDPHPGSGTDAHRARHTGAAPDPYARHSHPDANPSPSPDDWPPRNGNGYAVPGRPPGGHGGYTNGAVPAYPPGAGDDPEPVVDEQTAAYPVVDAGAQTAAYPMVQPPEPSEPPRRRQPGKRRAGRPGTAAGPKPPSRAGRNLPAAIGVGVTLGAVLVGTLFAYRPAFLVVIALAFSVGIWEMTRAVRAVDARPPMVPLLAGGVLMTGLAWQVGPDGLLLGLVVTVLAALVWRIGDGWAGYRRDLTASVLIAVYVPFLGGFAALMAAMPDGDWRIFVILAAVVLSDTGGYAVGVLLGRHPMAPSISPKKSWEGFGGSVTAAAVGSALLLYFLLDVAPWWGAVFGVAVSVAAVLGDLAESMIKRDLNIKDMSNLLPGHGGLMDRLDSVLFAVPTAYFLLTLFAPPG